jgi:hypothetical protein
MREALPGGVLVYSLEGNPSRKDKPVYRLCEM